MSPSCVLVPSDERSVVSKLIALAGMNVPAGVCDECRIVRIRMDLRAAHWHIIVRGPKSAESVVKDSLGAAVRAFAGEAMTLTIDYIPTDADIFLWVEGNWQWIAAEIGRDMPVLGGLLRVCGCGRKGDELVIRVPGHVQAEVLREKRCHCLVQALVERNTGRRVEFAIEPSELGDKPPEEEYAPPALSVPEPQPRAQVSTGRRRKNEAGAVKGRLIKGEARPISDIVRDEKDVIVSGEVFDLQVRVTKNGLRVVSFSITDHTDSISCKCFVSSEESMPDISDGQWVKLRGQAQYDQYVREIVIVVADIVLERRSMPVDPCDEKRIELHAHTKMSAMDATADVGDLIGRAASYGHRAIAITDHGVVQAFPEAFEAGEKHGIKIIYGMEGYLVDDQHEGGRVYHVTLLARNPLGLKNLYQLVTKSHISHFHRHPTIPRQLLSALREGILVGSACEAGEVFSLILEGSSEDEIRQAASFYDYLEIMPVEHNAFLVRQGRLRSIEAVMDINRRIYGLGKSLAITVVATGDVHFVDERDGVYRRVLLGAQGYQDADFQPPLHFRTTKDMLDAFAYLGDDACREVVVTAPASIADMIEPMKPIPDGLASPEIEGADEEVAQAAFAAANSLYGDPLPHQVMDRLNRELRSIVSNGFSAIFLIARNLVRKSLSDGYLVGSRGSVGSSLVATMLGITEVNPLPAHYLCSQCRYSEFPSFPGVTCGYDLPRKDCPVCGALLVKDGHDIPFEVFMGFEGDKVPDIDLNFSGEYQSQIHKFCEEIFGSDNVFRAGTIATVADKTAYGFVKSYCESKGLVLRSAELARLARGCTGVRRTTGQHPGGLMVLPRGRDIHDFTPVQYPANDVGSATITTHFDYKAIHSRLLKLDLLGHDDPTMIRMLQDLTGVDPLTIPMDDPQTLSIFSSSHALYGSAEAENAVGTLAIPEFGTRFVRGMLEETRPNSFAELVRISGLSHGTDVWLNNAQDIIRQKLAPLSEVISVRDDIMNYLIAKGLPPKAAFKIMERVRKGKGLSEEDAELMRRYEVPEWYVNSCRKIKYMFPKAHAAAYVMMAFRIAYFKVHYPIEFYCAYFTIRADEFDATFASLDEAGMKALMLDLETKADQTTRDKGVITILEVAIEALKRGICLLPVDIHRSQATRFAAEEGGLRLPLVSVAGLGQSAAISVVEARKCRPFSSVEDLRERTRLTKAHIEALKSIGAVGDIPDTDQLSLFHATSCAG